MSACEGSCRMCPFTTMSSNNAPSESRPLAMWVILRISPSKIQLNHRHLSDFNLLTLFTSKIIKSTFSLLTAYKHLVELTMYTVYTIWRAVWRPRPFHSYLWQTPPVSPAWRCLLLACSRWQPLLLPVQWSSRQGSELRWAFSSLDLKIKGRRRAYHLLGNVLRKFKRFYLVLITFTKK